MRRLAVALALTLLAACASDDPPAAQPDPLATLRAAAALAPCPTSVGDVPDLTLPCLGGGPEVRLKGTGTGTPTLVNVYGSWCAPCQDEMPILAAFAKRAGDKVALLGVDTQDDPNQALQFAVDFEQHWPAVVDDEGRFMRRYSNGPPVTLFVDGTGKVRFVKRGPFDSLAELTAAVRAHLEVIV